MASCGLVKCSVWTGLPGLDGTSSFWWVMALIVAAGVATLGALLWRQRR